MVLGNCHEPYLKGVQGSPCRGTLSGGEVRGCPQAGSGTPRTPQGGAPLNPPQNSLLNIIHSFHTTCAMTLRQFFNSGRAQHLLSHLVDFLPDLAQGTPWRELAESGIG